MKLMDCVKAFVGALGIGAVAVPAASVSAADESSRDEASLDRGAKIRLMQEILRQLKPYWSPPSANRRASTTVSFELDRNGGLIADPVIVRQAGWYGGDEMLAAEHARRAKEAVLRAAPFDYLPMEYHQHWKKVTVVFDLKLAGS